MPPRRFVIFHHRVHLGQRSVRFREALIQTHRFQQQPQRLFLAAFYAIELRQVVVRPRIRGLALDPSPLLFHMPPRLLVERRLNHFLTPETHFPAPTRMTRTSITFVFVGPVITRSPNDSK